MTVPLLESMILREMGFSAVARESILRSVILSGCYSQHRNTITGAKLIDVVTTTIP